MNSKRALFVSVIFSILLISIPWEELKGREFVDKIGYFDYVLYGQNALEFRSFDSFISYITQEWLWHYLLLVSGEFVSYPIFFYFVSFLTIASMSYYLVKRHGAISCFLLVNPLTINLAMSQYRSSFALSLILLATAFNKYKKVKIALIVVACFIHTSMLLLIATYIAIRFFSKLTARSSLLYLLSLIFLGFSLSIILSDFVKDILALLGDRRADYEIDRLSSSIQYLSFWLLNLLFVLYNYAKKPVRNMNDSFTIVVLSMIALNAVIGGYSTRMLALFLPVIMTTNLSLKAYPRLIIILIYITYTILQWYYWFVY